MKYKLSELVDINGLQLLLDSLYRITKIPSSLVDIDGTILVSNGWRNICKNFYRTNDFTGKNCIKSDNLAMNATDYNGYLLYRCDNGLTLVAAPILIEDMHVGTLFIGQFFTEKPNMAKYEKIADYYGFNKDEFIKAIKEIPLMSSEDIKPIAEFIQELGNTFAMVGYNQMKQLKMQEMLRLSEDKFKIAIEGANDGLWDWNLVTGKVSFSKKIKDILGYKDNEMGNNFDSWKKLIHPDDVKKVTETLKDYCTHKISIFQDSHRIRTKDGEYKWFQDRAIAVWDEDLKPVRIIGFYNDITQKMNYESKINHLAYFDALTNLPNKLYLFKVIHEKYGKSGIDDHNIAFLSMDIDNFKRVNDTFGHEIGDRFLNCVSKILHEYINENDLLCRFSGDEFLLVIFDYNSVDEVIQKAENLLNISKKIFHVKTNKIHITLSIGIALSKECISLDELLKNADIALYKAKTFGKNKYIFYDKNINEEIKEKVNLEINLREAIENDEFILYYQPQINAKTNMLVGNEALVRWNNPKLGIISPSKFIPIAEETGLIVPLGKWILLTACRQNKIWQDNGYGPIRITVNISEIQLQQKDFFNQVVDVLNETKLPPRFLELEITETIMMKFVESNLKILNQLKDIGVKIAIDDFGVGYSSLNYLKLLPIDTLKIDKTFIDNICTSPKEAAITDGIIQLANKMNLEVIAEGVEKEEQLNMLVDRKCNNIQGFIFSKPYPADILEENMLKKLYRNENQNDYI